MNAWTRIDGAMYRCNVHDVTFSVNGPGSVCAGCVATPKRPANIDAEQEQWERVGDRVRCTVHHVTFADDEMCRACWRADVDAE